MFYTGWARAGRQVKLTDHMCCVIRMASGGNWISWPIAMRRDGVGLSRGWPLIRTVPDELADRRKRISREASWPGWAPIRPREPLIAAGDSLFDPGAIHVRITKSQASTSFVLNMRRLSWVWWRSRSNRHVSCTDGGQGKAKDEEVNHHAPSCSSHRGGFCPTGYLVLNIGDPKLFTGGVTTGNLERHTGGYVWDIPDVDAHTHTLSDVTDAGTAAGLDVLASGDAATGQAVKGDDLRRTDPSTPSVHPLAIADATDLQTTLDGKLALAGGTMTDGANIALGTTTGTQIGTTADQRSVLGEQRRSSNLPVRTKHPSHSGTQTARSAGSRSQRPTFRPRSRRSGTNVKSLPTM